MALALTVVVFLTIALVVFSFGAAAYAPSSLLGSRLRALGGQRTKAPEKPALKERLEQALDPFSKAIPLSPSDVSRTRRWLIQAGYRETRHLTVYVGSRLATAHLRFGAGDRWQRIRLSHLDGQRGCLWVLSTSVHA